MPVSENHGTCPDCTAPTHWVPRGSDNGAGAWYHDMLVDSWTCWTGKAACESKAA